MHVHLPTQPDALDAYLANVERGYRDIRPGLEKAIVWADDEARSKTELAFVYLHGFSASRREIYPVCDRLAARFGANLFYTRLTGHGRTGEAMLDISCDAMLSDASEALEIGRRLGERVIVVATSTGATLAIWLALTQACPRLAGLVLLAPNFKLKDWRSELLRWRLGQRLAMWIQGPTYSFPPVNAEHASSWTTSYPSAALVPLMELMMLVRRQDLRDVRVPALTFLCRDDRVVDGVEAARRVAMFRSQPNVLVEIDDPGDSRRHILAGDAVSPETTDRVVEEAARFVAAITHTHPRSDLV